MVVAEGKRSVLDVALLLPTLFDASQNPVPPEAVGAFCHAAASFDGHCSLEIVSEDASALALALVASLTAFWNKSIRLVRVFYETASSQLTPHSGGKQQSSGECLPTGTGTVCVWVHRVRTGIEDRGAWVWLHITRRGPLLPCKARSKMQTK